MRRQKVLVAGSGACVLVLTMVAAAVAHMAGGDSAGTGDAGTVALQNSRAGSARVLGLPIRDAQLGDPLNGWTGEQGSGVGFLPLRPDAPPLPDFLGTSTASPGHLDELRTLGNDFSWLNEYGRSFRLANVGTSFTFRPGNGGGLGGGGASRSPGGGTGGGGGSQGGGGDNGGDGLDQDLVDITPTPPPTEPAPGDSATEPPADQTGGGDGADGIGVGDDDGNGNDDGQVAYDPPPEGEIDQPEAPEVPDPSDDLGLGDPTVPIQNPDPPGQPSQTMEVPEPGILSLLGVASGLLGLGAVARRRRS